MAEHGLSHNISLSELEDLPIGPTFIDDEECICTLQEKLNIEVWRCIDSPIDNISEWTGKWFFAVNQTDSVSLRDPLNSDRNPPNLTTSYVIEGDGQNAKFALITSSDNTTDFDDSTCSGKKDTKASSVYYRYAAIPAVSSLIPCWQPGIIALMIQNASEWNATGCNLGFFCKCFSPIGWGDPKADTYKSAHHRSEQHGP